MYCDTDSVVFTTTPGQWEPLLGDYLGDLTDEVSGNTITNFVTGGPKNYAFRLATPNKTGQISICKVRGITLNFKNSLEFNYDTVQEMVTSNNSKVISVIDDHKLVRNPSTGHILTKLESKDYRIVFNKRVISEDYNTYPYGF